jgi:DNA polymerase III subunit delta
VCATAPSRLGGVSELKPTYLVCGDDEARIDAWRARVHERASSDPDASLEVLRDERPSGAAAAEAIGALTLATGRRWVLVDGVEKWKEADVKQVQAALATQPPDTVVVLIANGKAPAKLAKTVEGCGGEVRACEGPTARQYSSWTQDRARELGLALDPEAAGVLVARAPRDEKNKLRQNSVIRELEKLATYAGEDAAIDAATVEAVSASGVESRTYELADAVIEGKRERALEIAEDLRSRGEDMMYILFALLRRLRDTRRAWAMVSSGKSVGDVQSALRVPPFVARRMVSQTKGMDGERFERAFGLLADLDWAIRGAGDLDPDSTLTLTLAGAGRETPGRP